VTAAAVFGSSIGLIGSKARLVELRITLPNGATPQLSVHEGDTASVTLKEGGRFGFRPVFKQDSNSEIDVTIFDLGATPARQLEGVEVVVGQPGVKSHTTPTFVIQVSRIQEN
ncbi:MAG TPA: hypothetical protein VFK20_00840, partial [Vicinamibacterales bacterium]|nr:hypothetical protein [Vicinamibacterales bacterium]